MKFNQPEAHGAPVGFFVGRAHLKFKLDSGGPLIETF
jgi:hypothetical protein